MLNSSNYLKWKVQVIDALTAGDYWFFTNPDTAPKADGLEGVALINWKRVNSRICGLLRGRYEAVQRTYIADIEDASRAWTILAARLKPRGSGPLDGTFTRLESLSAANCSGLQDYTTKFELVVNELHEFSPNLFTNWLIHRFHRGLVGNTDYEAYKTQYNQTYDPFNEAGNPNYNLQYVMTRILQTLIPIEDTTGVALVTTTPAVHKQAGIKPRSATRVITKTVKYYTHCGKDYHLIDKCQLLHPELRKPKRKGGNNRGNSGSSGGNNKGKGNKSNKTNKDGKPKKEKDKDNSKAEAYISFALAANTNLNHIREL
ncbi:MAG: hypothetical protein Q9181_005618 [Wetmoreana brouardii]